MLNKENKKNNGGIFCSRTTKVAVLLSIYISSSFFVETKIIFMGFGGVGTLPQMLEVLGAIPK